MSLAEHTWERRHLRQELRTLTKYGERAVDFGVAFQAVGPANENDRGAIWVRSTWVKPCANEERLGGVLDPLKQTWLDEKLKQPRPVLLFGEAQRPPLEFGDDESIRRMVVVGSMGSGKTEILVRWLTRMGQRFRGSTVLVVAPTSKRILIIWRKLRKVLPQSWILPGKAGIRTSLAEIELYSGLTYKFVAAKEASKQTGVPFAGIDAVAAGIDEEQDCAQMALDELEMRGRDSPDGYFPVLSTCTIKDSIEFRERKAKYERQKGCVVYKMLLSENPFVPASFIEGLRHSLSPRAFRMRVLAEDARPERATYPDFDREKHIRTRPELGIVDITREVTGADLLIGHDPGSLCDVSTLLRCYRIRGRARPVWWILDELTTRPGANAKRHSLELARLVKKYGHKPKNCVIRADPYGDTEDTPGITVYREFQLKGFSIRPTVYKKTANASDAHKPGKLPKEDRIQTVCGLMLNEAGDTRLFMEPDANGLPKARETCVSFEVEERDETGKAETQRKDANDRSHWGASVGYALYPYEHTPPVGLAIGSM